MMKQPRARSTAPRANAAGQVGGGPLAAAPGRTVHMVGNAHLDAVWLWPWQEGYQEARATFRSALDRMDEYPDFVFTCDQVVLLSWVEEQDPALFARIVEREREGRWVNAGGWWVEPDCNMPTGESFARQGLYGQRFLLSRFGRAARVGMNVDPFGHNAMLPQVLVGQGMHAYCFLRPMAYEKGLPQNLFRWTAPDGSAVTAFRIPYEYQNSRETVERHLEKSVAELGELGEVMVFYGVGNHGGGPTKRQIDAVHRSHAMGTFGSVVLSSPETYFDSVLARPGTRVEDLPVVYGDLQHHAPGCYSAHSGIKLWERKAQSALLVAERWAAIASTTGGPAYPRADLEGAWKQVLFNQFHDILPGSAIEAAYDDARDQLGGATATAKAVTARAQNVLASRIDIPLDPSTQPVVVFNPHPWPVTAEVELHLAGDETIDPFDVTGPDLEPLLSQPIPSRSQVGRTLGAAIAVEAELPPLGYRVLTLHHAGRVDQAERPRLPAIASGSTVLENELIRAELDPATGWFRSLLDKRTGVDLIAGAVGEHTQICEDPTDTWGHRVVSYAWPGSAMEVTRIRVRENGPLRACIRVERAWNSSTLVEDFRLSRNSDSIEVQVTLTWSERGHLLKLRVPVALDEPTGTVEIPYGSIERAVNGSEEPGQSWIDLSGTVGGVRAGLALVNDAKHGYDVSPASADAGRPGSPSIGVTAVRSPVFAWHDPTLLDADGDYAYQDLGTQRWTYRLVPHAGDWRDAELHRRAAELNVRPRAMLESFHPGPEPSVRSFVAGETGPVVVTAVKGAEDPNDNGSTDLIVRAVETLGRRSPFVLDLPLLGRRIEEEVEPYRIRTWRVPVDPDLPIAAVNLLEQPLEPRP